MRKIYNSLRIVTLLGLILSTACSENFDQARVEDSFTGFDKELTMQSLAADDFAADDFTFTAVSDWKSETTEDWITVTPESGKAGVNTIEIATSGNYTKEARRGTIYIVSGQYKIALIIDQSELDKDGNLPKNPDYKFKVVEGDKDMTIYADELTFPEFAIYSPDKWSRELTFADDQSEWLSVEGAATGNEGEYAFDIKPFAINITGKSNSATLTFKLTDEAEDAEGVEDLVINIVQEATDKDGNAVQLKFNYEDGADADRAIDANVTEFTSFTFNAEAVWSAELTSMDWCTVTPTSGVAGEYTITFDATALNTTSAAKSGSIKLSYDDDTAQTPKTVEFDITQNNTVAGSAFTFDFANANSIDDVMAYTADSRDITFDAPFAWVANSSADWLSLSITEGESATACAIKASAEENTMKMENVSNVTIKSAMPNYDGEYAELTYVIKQAENPNGEEPIKYTSSLADFKPSEAYAAYQAGRYILEITDGGELTDDDLQAVETYLNPGDGKPTSGSIILSLPNVTRLITTEDKIEGSGAKDAFVLNNANAIRELWLPSLTVRPHKLWNLGFLEVLYMPKAGGSLVYDIFKTTGKQTAAGGLSVLVIGVDAGAVLDYSKGKAFKNCGNLSECKFYTSEANMAELEQALKGSSIKYGPIITDEVYTPEEL